MIAKNPEQRMQYDARLKFQMDEAGRLEQVRLDALREIELACERARIEGEARGLHRGELLGRIRVLQELLGVDAPAANELSRFDEPDLLELANQLQDTLRHRQ